MNIVQLSPAYFPNPNKSAAVSEGYIYVGLADTDPTIEANQKTLYALQEDGSTVAVAQPIRTNSGGMPVYNGSVVTLLVDGTYSLTVLSSASVTLFYVPNSNTYSNTEIIYANDPVYGATPNLPTEDQKANIQAALDAGALIANKPFAGAIVFLGPGTFYVSGPLEIPSGVTLQGSGRLATRIAAMDTATISANQGVLQTEDFDTTKGTGAADYQDGYPTGVSYEVGIRDLTVYGNRANITNGNGIALYGCRWNLQNIGVYGAGNNGIWTEYGTQAFAYSSDQEEYLAMMESKAINVRISSCGNHGWLYRGPNDSFIDDIIVRQCDYSGFYQDGSYNTTGLKIGSLHAYACACGGSTNYMMYFGAAIQVLGGLCVDSSHKGGVVFKAGAVINQIYSFKNNKLNAGAYDGIDFDAGGADITVGVVRAVPDVRTSGTTGSEVRVQDGFVSIGTLTINRPAGTTINSTGLKLDSAAYIGMGIIEDFDVVGDYGVIFNGANASINLRIQNCDTGFYYNTAGGSGSILNLGLNGNSTGVEWNVARSIYDIINIQETGTITNYQGNTIYGSYQTAPATKAFSNPITINADAYNSSIVTVEDMTSASILTMGGSSGKRITTVFTQDGTGGWDLTFAAGIITNHDNTGNTAGKVCGIDWSYNGTNWIGISTGWQ